MIWKKAICLLCCCLLMTVSWSSTIDLDIMALISVDQTGAPTGSGKGAAAYLEMVFENVNNRDDILEGYNLKLHYGNAGRSVGVCMDSLYKLLYNPPTKIMLMGGPRSDICMATADGTASWNITQMAYGCGTPKLNDRKKYRRFFRTVPDHTRVVEMHMALMNRYSWKRLATVHEPMELFSTMTEQLVQAATGENFTVLTSEVFYDHPKVQVQNLKRHDARIIFINTYGRKALQILCEAYKEGLYGRYIQWIAVTFFEDNWWRDAHYSTDCSTDEIYEAVQYVMYVGINYLNPIEKMTVSGLYRSQILPIYHEKTNYTFPNGYDNAGMTYDAPWAVALALNITQAKLRLSGSNKKLEDFAYNDIDFANLITESMREVKFTGLLGEHNFANNHPEVTFGVFQQIGTEKQFVAYYSDGEMHEVNGGLQWKDGVPMADSSLTIYKKVFVSPYLYILFCSISAVGMLLSVFLLIFNTFFSQKRVVKMSSPNINNLILVGCLFAYAVVFFQDLPGGDENALAFCISRNFIFVIGFCLAYGALFSKTWRVHRVLTRSKSFRQVKIKDSQLVSIVFGLALVETLVLILWQVVDPIEMVIKNLPLQEVDRNQITIYQVTTCQSRYDIYFTGAIYIIQGIMMAFGAFLAWETRKVQMEALNDSKLIGVCIYNVLILSVLGVAINRVVDDVNTAYGFASGFIVTGTTLTQCIIFIPKVLAVKRNDELIMPLGSLSEKPNAVPGTSSTFGCQLTEPSFGRKPNASTTTDKF